MITTSFLKKIMGGGTVIEPFSRVLLGGKTKKRTSRKTKKNTKRKKNISRKKATRRVERSNKRSINKRTNRKGKGERKKVNRGTVKRKKTLSKKKRQCNCDTSRTYLGNEPSPKGLGFCAHCTPLNVTMKGLDGNLWENQKYTKGKRWIKVRVDMN
jgi:phage protein D